ncbi:MAG: CSLREA domain-containing protein [Anaerolineaceae bacterium]|nr:CSLREA domain-containing protein [Anaerolineaceae bacterium]
MFTVNTADDEDNGYCSWRHCSLREAIQAANALNGGHHDDDDDDDDGAYSQYRYGGNSYYADEIIIKFDIDGLDPIVIAPTSALPAITTSLELKGDTASIVLDGSEAGQADGLLLAADDILVRGLTIRNFAGNGLVINGSNNRVEDSVMSENGGSGIVVLDGSGNLLTKMHFLATLFWVWTCLAMAPRPMIWRMAMKEQTAVRTQPPSSAPSPWGRAWLWKAFSTASQPAPM